MPERVAFKSGKDLGEEKGVCSDETMTCSDCGAVQSDRSAYEEGWQLAPPVCPNCLTRLIGDEVCCFGNPT